MNARLATTEAPNAVKFFVLRPLSSDDKKRDLMCLISWGRSLLDPRSVGATKPPARKLADPHRIENPPVDRGDGVAWRSSCMRCSGTERSSLRRRSGNH